MLIELTIRLNVESTSCELKCCPYMPAAFSQGRVECTGSEAVCGEGGFAVLTTAELLLLPFISYEPVLLAGLFAVAVSCADLQISG
ncbi:unnamed protein product [Arctia plantaginis]|uniref:Uncharacterized protein n=1 Tax=Arctia plantaginis TaxID=874455 RepID=A0A8S0YVW5_ARCPL|nr:unnamed protein product [Arctia plantaginis]CAB3253786.1 unnamed protein product [Arctia plantaginis]